MKKYFICFFILIFVNVVIFSENIEISTKEDNKKWTIQTSPLLYIWGILGIMNSYETGGIEVIPFRGFPVDLEGQYKINEKYNVSLALSYYIRNISRYTSPYEWQLNIKPMFIYRPLKTGLEGFYIGIYPTIGFFSFSHVARFNYSSEYGNLFTNLGFGLNTGYKWIFNNGFTLQLGGGIGKSWFLPSKNLDYYDIYPYNRLASDSRILLRNFDLSFDFKLGYSF